MSDQEPKEPPVTAKPTDYPGPSIEDIDLKAILDENKAARSRTSDLIIDASADIHVHLAKKQEEVRYFVTKWITILFCVLVTLAVIVVMAGPWMPEYSSEDMVDRLLKVIQGTALPVVTLVLGFYFGASSGK